MFLTYLFFFSMHPASFYAFWFNAPCQFTLLLNLSFLPFDLTLFGWLPFITLTPYFWWKYYFLFSPSLLYPQCFRNSVRA